MERAQRLYDCITEVSDQYIQEAECVEIRQGKILAYPWKRIGSLAAALVLVAGMSYALPRMMGGGGAASSAPAASAPETMEPSVEEPAMEDIQDVEQSTGVGRADGGHESLQAGVVIRLSDEEHCVILSGEEAFQRGLPEDLEEAIAGEAFCQLTWQDGAFVPAGEESGIVLYPCAPDIYIVSDGKQYLAAAIIQGR